MKSGKRFNTLEATRLIFELPEIWFNSIREMDRNNEHFIRESSLIARVRTATKHFDDSQKKKVGSLFNFNHLYDNQIISDFNVVDGERQLVIQEHLLGLLRLCEIDLHQGLTDSRFRSKLSELRSVKKRLVATGAEAVHFDMDNPDFSEMVNDLMLQLSSLLGVLRNSVIAMQDLSSKIEGVSAEASRSPDLFREQSKEIYGRVNNIYERHVQPILFFLNPKGMLPENEENLFEVITACKDAFESKGLKALADQVFKFSMSFTNMYKPVESISHEVSRFIRKTRQGILELNAISSLYQELEVAYERVLGSSMTVSMMKTYLVYEKDFSPGLKKQDRPLTYSFSDSAAYIDNILEDIRLRLALTEIAKPVILGAGSINKEHQQYILRNKEITKLLNMITLKETDDLTLFLHERLTGSIDAVEGVSGYSFVDLLSSMSSFYNRDKSGNLARYGFHMVHTNIFKIIENQEWSYSHRVHKLKQMSEELA